MNAETEPTPEPTEPTEPTPEPTEPTEPSEPTEPTESPTEPTPNPEAIAAARQRDLEAAEAAEAAERKATAATAEEPDETDRAIVAAQELYITTVVDTLGPDAEVIPCPTCHGFAFLSATLPLSQSHERCSDCQGRGSVQTGSLVESQRELPCVTCNGNGWTHKTKPLELPTGQLQPVGPQALEPVTGPPPPLLPETPGQLLP